LSDAAFFFAQDKKQTLEQHLGRLAKVVYQQNLGSLLDKSERIAALMPIIAPALKLDTDQMKHAALLCKADLTCQMVNEFPELQGIMGACYAQHEQQDEKIVSAIREHYQPQGASDEIPSSLSGAALAIADKIDTLAGIFAIGKKPSGDKDPFALKRAMSGILRIMIEKRLPLDLNTLFTSALTLQAQEINTGSVLLELLTFAWDRLDTLLREEQFPPGLLHCVTTINLSQPYDMMLRLYALKAFMDKVEAASLASTHKRVNNLLTKTQGDKTQVNQDLLLEAQEIELAQLITQQHAQVLQLCLQQNYPDALLVLAELKPALDAFFDKVMVMCEDEALKQNRLALLRQLNALFLLVADFSYLPVIL
ncbi:MAG TPA: glycine--tRNA ligase subunit beta, partial [Gammaproteobacteria bacterium]|nr:glycine--tRNA ligase subunit beta [Gammaproteobacteria bacterium]